MERNFNRIYTVSPLFSIFLLFISILLILVTAPFGLIYSFIYQLKKKLFIGLGNYCLSLAIVLDIFGNIVMQDIFNKFMIKNNGYKFGAFNETISNVLGKNQIRGTLKPIGKALIYILEQIESEHCLNSIKYSEQKNVSNF